MIKKLDITGRRFGRLTALREAGPGPSWQMRWVCRCDCGREVTVYKANLLSGHTKSCGCLRREWMATIRKQGYGNNQD